jgi:hypothetical protein
MKGKITSNKQEFNGASLCEYGGIWIPGAPTGFTSLAVIQKNITGFYTEPSKTTLHNHELKSDM